MRENQPLHSSSEKRFIIGWFRKAKLLAVTVGLSMVLEIVYPNVCLAVTAGPSSPEFASFEPVATTNMVNEFTGQFTYNVPVLEIPGAAGGGYALSLSYHSGDGPENEASWVGHGWTLNPGAINRSTRGIPDDYNGNNVTYYNSVPANWTVAASLNAGAEFFSGILGVGANWTVSYNNYKGFGITSGRNLSVLKGFLSLGVNMTNGQDATFSAGINPAGLLNYLTQDKSKDADVARKHAEDRKPNVLHDQIARRIKDATVKNLLGMAGAGATQYLHFILTSQSSPYNLTPYSGYSIEGAVNVTWDPPPAPIGLSGGVAISYVDQENVGVRNVPTFGYMYTGNGNHTYGNNTSSDSEAIMDYVVDNSSTFTMRDKYLPVPVSTPDGFFATGEGMAGGFRMYNDRIGLFSPNFIKSTTSVYHFGIDVHLGLDIGLGADLTLPPGSQSLTVESRWHHGNGNTNDYWFVPYGYKDSTHIESENMFFRFNSDLGGKVLYDNSDKPVSATISGGRPYLPFGGSPSIIKDGNVPGTARRSGRASHIAYHTNAEINTFLGGRRPLAYEQRSDINGLAGRSSASTNPALADEIGEISTINEGGNRFTYGLPVYTAGQTNMRQGLNSVTTPNQFLVHGTLGTAKVGEQYTTPYASQYLLTEITTPDYLDVNANGPDDADFGGYTKFIYKRVYGSNVKSGGSGWYKYRTPYHGVFFQPNRLSDNADDMGSYQSGYKEVYYLDTIQTKTHYAVFILDARVDGYDANGSDVTAAIGSYMGSNAPRKLKKIELYAKSTHAGFPDQLIKTVNFDYDYQVWPGNVNSTGGNGKLTLKKVWFEYNGVVSAKISPYQFEYTYPTVTYPSEYSYIASEMAAHTPSDQMPSYTPFLDCWGNYQYDMSNRRQKMKCWAPQVVPNAFDHAAWQLKRIILPSGGEIHVQYEQNTYSYVQDRPACALVSLLDDAATVASGNMFTLNTSELGITSLADKVKLANLIKATYTNKKIFFKFFYTLKGWTTEDIGNCNGDYIQGHATFENSFVDGSGNVRVQISGAPKQVCKDYIHYQVGGRLLDGNCSSPSHPGRLGLAGSVEDQLKSMVTTFLSTILISNPLGNLTICLRAKNDVSYLRIPVPVKTGGGVRVKRLMMYNKGIDVGSPSLYGTEYIYDNESDGTSYGVATNEPSENRGENPMVTHLPKRDEQEGWDRLMAGRDVEQFEGPLCWDALPEASIGYSRIIKKNIHQTNATTTGYTVIDYNTVKDYPFDRYYPEVDAYGSASTPIQKTKDNFSFDFDIFRYSIRTGMQSSQGFCFIKNQMHGQIKQIADYRGKYDPVKFYDVTNPPVPVSQKNFSYFEPGEQVPMYDYNTWTTYLDQPGKETDITIDRRNVTEHSHVTRLTGDITIGVAPFPPFFIPWTIGFPLTSYSDQNMSSIAVNKMIHYPCILKSTTVMQDGYFQRTDNVAFDPLTTKPVLTSTYDGFNGISLPMDFGNRHNGKYTTYNVPASSNYQAMGQKAWNERFCYFAPSISVSSLGSSNYLVPGVNGTSIFTPGDLIALHYSSTVAMAHVIALSGSDLIVTPSLKYNSTIPSGGAYNKVEIIQSGYTNQLASSMDGLTEYGNNSDVQLAMFLARLRSLMHLVELGFSPQHLDMAPYSFRLSAKCAPTGPCIDCDTSYYINGIDITGGSGNIFMSSTFMHAGYSSGAPMGYVYGASGHYGIGFSPVAALGGDTGLIAFDSVSNMQFQTGQCMVPILCRRKYKNVIRAQVTTYSDQWVYNGSYGVDTVGLNHYESGMRGKWRPYETYVLRDTIVKGINVEVGQRNYNSGTVPFEVSQWSNIYNQYPGRWIRSNHIDAYSPNGHATQEVDAENVFSAAKYGYHGFLPYIVAQNAPVKSVMFESFENTYGSGASTTVEDGMNVSLSAIIADPHTGKYGYKRKPGESIVTPVVTDYSGHGFSVRFWTKVSGTPAGIFSVLASGSFGTTALPAVYVARSGAWALYEAKWNSIGSLPVNVTFTISNISTSDKILDDIRVQPTDAKVTSYVYDIGTYKLAAVLDDQHLATYYQYNGEGKLVRTMIETVRGNKTAEEAEYHIPRPIAHP